MTTRTKRRALLTAVALSTGMTMIAEGAAKADPSLDDPRCRIVKMQSGNTKGPHYTDVCLIDGVRKGHATYTPDDGISTRKVG